MTDRFDTADERDDYFDAILEGTHVLYERKIQELMRQRRLELQEIEKRRRNAVVLLVMDVEG